MKAESGLTRDISEASCSSTHIQSSGTVSSVSPTENHKRRAGFQVSEPNEVENRSSHAELSSVDNWNSIGVLINADEDSRRECDLDLCLGAEKHGHSIC
ncbi:hypothetical protein PSTT_07534 [Puccinia striiformis]|uniref:Uncharacterized protein n=1 Tax=Puccinia striiformis TaxID=27350 RepID=A0A2S4VG16_9BASI|nr:hypothetical protein PSTT_07534 [Puccinia striiformis]